MGDVKRNIAIVDKFLCKGQLKKIEVPDLGRSNQQIIFVDKKQNSTQCKAGCTAVKMYTFFVLPIPRQASALFAKRD